MAVPVTVIATVVVTDADYCTTAKQQSHNGSLTMCQQILEETRAAALEERDAALNSIMHTEVERDTAVKALRQQTAEQRRHHKRTLSAQVQLLSTSTH